MTLPQVLAKVDAIIKRQTRQLEADLLDTGADPDDVADLLTQQAAELRMWRTAFAEVVEEWLEEMHAPVPPRRIH